jgi:xanthine dehydrogenase accessory factor
MIAARLSRRADELRAVRAPFVVATVVRAQRPTSVHSGDAALVLGDGTIEGFVGGACAEQSVRLHALRALETGEALLLRILPGDDDAPAAEGAVTVQNPCLSGGSLEIFLEPMLVSPRVLVVGDTPIAHAVIRLGAELDLDMVGVPGTDVDPVADDLALVVAAHGRDELRALRRALEAGLPYVGLVASRVRGSAVVAELRDEGMAPERLAALETPAGLDLGARTPAEIALSILARIVTVRRGEQTLSLRVVAPAPAPATATATATAVDPVCGMAVAAVEETPHVEHDGRRVYFCCDGCQTAFEHDPPRYLTPH